jgi:epoxyqueuosine reductase QueG
MCRICQDNCPADAITGLTWNPKLERNDLFEYKKCLNVLGELAENEFHNPNVKVCSKCISVCPNTQRYVEK